MENFESRCATSGCTTMFGSFRPNGSSAVSSTYNLGGHFSVVRTSQGLFTLTLTDPAMSFIAVIATLQLATAAARYIQVGAVSASAKTIQIRVVDGSGSVQDVASDADNKICFIVVLKDRTV